MTKLTLLLPRSRRRWEPKSLCSDSASSTALESSTDSDIDSASSEVEIPEAETPVVYAGVANPSTSVFVGGGCAVVFVVVVVVVIVGVVVVVVVVGGGADGGTVVAVMSGEAVAETPVMLLVLPVCLRVAMDRVLLVDWVSLVLSVVGSCGVGCTSEVAGTSALLRTPSGFVSESTMAPFDSQSECESCVLVLVLGLVLVVVSCVSVLQTVL